MRFRVHAALCALLACAPDQTPQAGPPPVAAAQDWAPLEILGARVAPGERRELRAVVSEGFSGGRLATPVVVVRGPRPGPTLCLTGGIHGDEVNGIEIVRRSLELLEPQDLAGTLVAVPIANLHGFRRSSRYLPDRRDLNRHFPGRPDGSAASRIAHRLFDGVVRHCEALVDFHAGSFHRRNLPQVRGDLGRPEVLEVALGFGTPAVVHHAGLRGTLRRAAVEAGIPAITYEAGQPMEFEEDEVRRGVEGVRSLMARLRMTAGSAEAAPPELYYRARWVRADDGGLLHASVGLGEEVRAGQVLGSIIDPLSSERTPLLSPWSGRVIGMAVNQVVIPGFAAFHVGIDGERPSARRGADPIAEGEEALEVGERPE